MEWVMQSPLDLLREEILNQNAVFVIGAGLSRYATNDAPAASWAALLELGVQYCEQWVQPAPDPKWLQRQRASLAKPSAKTLTTVASQIERQLEAPRSGLYANFLRET